jgi:alpha-mannosidase
VVFNPNDTPQSGIVNLSIKLSHQYSSYEIIDGVGEAIPCDFSGLGARELISLVLDKKALKQAFRMIHEGHVAGMVVRDFNIEKHETHATVLATLSDHGNVNITRWREGVAQMDGILADPAVTEFHIHAYSDPEIKLSFVARDIPQHGYSCYWIIGLMDPGTGIPKPVKLSPAIQWLIPLIARVAQLPMVSKALVGKKNRANSIPKRIENEFFIVEALAADGSLTITDIRTQQVYSGVNRLIDTGDCGDLYNYCPPERDLAFSPKLTKVESEDHNTNKKLILYSTLRIPAKLSDDRKSRGNEWISNLIISTITLVPGVPRIDIHTEINNLAHDHRLRVHFPAPFSTTNAMHDGHFEIVQRQIGISVYDGSWEELPRPEVPQLQFTSITNERLSLTIANLGLPEVEVLKNHAGNSEIAITLLRSVGWLSRDDLTTRKSHAGPMEVAVPDAQMVGSFSFDYSIIPGDANWRDYIHQAHSFNAPLKSITTSMHPGTLPTMGSFIENTNEKFIITTLKTADDGSGLIIRGYNSLSSPIATSLKLLIPVKKVQLVSLDEKLVEPLSVSADGFFDLHIGGHKIITLRLLD